MPKAIICENDPDLAKIVSLNLKTAGFDCITPLSIEEALFLLNSDDISLISVYENFGDEPYPNNRVITHVNSLPMYLRRNVFLVLTGKNFKTLDRIQAFSLGANMVINSADMEKFGIALKVAYAEYQRIYRIFKEFLLK